MYIGVHWCGIGEAMIEFLTWNNSTAHATNSYPLAIVILLIAVPLIACVVTAFLDKHGAPDDDITFDPRYDEW